MPFRVRTMVSSPGPAQPIAASFLPFSGGAHAEQGSAKGICGEALQGTAGVLVESGLLTD